MSESGNINTTVEVFNVGWDLNNTLLGLSYLRGELELEQAGKIDRALRLLGQVQF